MQRLFYLLLICLSGLAGAADELAVAVRRQLVQAPVLRGQFEQRKSVAGFKKPLVSRGDFLLARERGVLWRTREPFASELKLTRDDIVATQGGDVSYTLSAAKEPAIRLINSLLFDLLNGNVDGLDSYFSVAGASGEHDWQLALTPRQPALAKMMSKVELRGDRYVEQITIDEANGDHTEIRLSGQSSQPANLSTAEAARF